jgi:D-alanyl-lipoteichoic acid acyltransferase DltB (MBOAT superfamily)
MAFNSYSYLLALIPAVVGYWLVPANFRRWYVLAMSLLFYATWKPAYVVLPLVVCSVTYLCGRRIEAQPDRKSLWLRTGIVFVLIVLVVFKYREFLLANLNAVFGAVGLPQVTSTLVLLLPLGLSFYTFEAISYLIDTVQGRTKKATFSDVALFVMFWPHLMAGPIVRFRELVPQFAKPLRFQPSMLVLGLDRLIVGLVQKSLLANNLGLFADEGFLPKAAGTNSGLDNWALAFAFGLQIYFDFASYSNMAIGAAHLLGITLPENFRFPYHASNPSEFWSRWHMTLSRWIRDYLFFPINAKYEGRPLPLYASLLGIMTLVGLWHGAGWGFLVWGFLHGAYLVLYRIWERFQEPHPADHWSRSAAAVWGIRLLTIGGVFLAWIPFRASTLDQTLAMFSSMLTPFTFRLSYSVNSYLVTLLAAVFCLLEPWIAARLNALESRLLQSVPGPALNVFLLRPLLYAAGLFLFLLFDDSATQFIYFQF